MADLVALRWEQALTARSSTSLANRLPQRSWSREAFR